MYGSWHCFYGLPSLKWSWQISILKIGPIPTDDGIGKEVITRMTANMATNKVFYTDSNGRDFLKRVILGMTFLFKYW